MMEFLVKPLFPYDEGSQNLDTPIKLASKKRNNPLRTSPPSPAAFRILCSLFIEKCGYVKWTWICGYSEYTEICWCQFVEMEDKLFQSVTWTL